ncbi:hypothetical protein GCM10012275_62060 [Longimycelium tulufanense]|uniref:Uncharacterized protein n=1 Tax=Longimycelium tulufanense TaxID=907463 RepID=A0A8J3FZB1_9PSEU|nr:hypothetical protein [Longimycelium tulufanense]GGM83068.1 hypothetical protein GCM10012275_62060 [Longimycelium tulufanense]
MTPEVPATERARHSSSGGITLAGADHLATLVTDWHHADRPPATAWSVTLRHADTSAADLLLPHHWTLTHG